MGISEKKRRQHLNRKLKKKRKEYIRHEKESIRRQEKELKQIRKRRKRKDKQEFLTLLQTFVNPSRQKRVTPTHLKRQPGIFQRLQMQWRETKKARKENKKLAKRKHVSLKRQYQFFRENQRSIRKERRHRRIKSSLIRSKIRKARMASLQLTFISFIKKPVKVRRLKPEEKILRDQIKRDIKELRRHRIRNFPAQLSKMISNSLTKRHKKIQYARKRMMNTILPLSTDNNARELQSDLYKTTFNSTLMFVVAFWIMYFTSQLATILTAQFYSIQAVLYSYTTYWPFYTYSASYSRLNLIVIFGMGPVVCLVTAFLLFRLFSALSRKRLNLKMLIFWMVLHGMNMFFGAYVAGVFTRTGFNYASAWIFNSDAFDIKEIIFMIISVIVLIITGLRATRQFISASLITGIIQPKIRFFYIVAQVFLPWLLGNFLIYVINFPNNPMEFMILLGMSFIMVFPTFINYNSPANRIIRIHMPPGGVKIG